VCVCVCACACVCICVCVCTCVRASVCVCVCACVCVLIALTTYDFYMYSNHAKVTPNIKKKTTRWVRSHQKVWLPYLYVTQCLIPVLDKTKICVEHTYCCINIALFHTPKDGSRKFPNKKLLRIISFYLL